MSLRICFVGDSFVAGYGDPEFLGWVGRLCAATRARGLDLTCYNLGVRRDTSRDIRARWREEVMRRLPSLEEAHLVFSFGANDTALEAGHARVSLAESLANCRAILTEARQMCPTLMVGPPPFADARAELLGDLSAQLADVCAQVDVPFLDIWTPLSGSGTFVRETAAGDGAHPAAGGYAEIAALVRDWPAWTSWFPQGGLHERDEVML